MKYNLQIANDRENYNEKIKKNNSKRKIICHKSTHFQPIFQRAKKKQKKNTYVP